MQKTPGRRPAGRPAARRSAQHADPQHAERRQRPVPQPCRWARRAAGRRRTAHTQRIQRGAHRGGVASSARGLGPAVSARIARSARTRPPATPGTVRTDAAGRTAARRRAARSARPATGAAAVEVTRPVRVRRVARFQPCRAVPSGAPPTVHRRIPCAAATTPRPDEVQARKIGPAGCPRSRPGTWYRVFIVRPLPACPARSAEPYFGECGLPEPRGSTLIGTEASTGEHLSWWISRHLSADSRSLTSLVAGGGGRMTARHARRCSQTAFRSPVPPPCCSRGAVYRVAGVGRLRGADGGPGAPSPVPGPPVSTPDGYQDLLNQTTTNWPAALTAIAWRRPWTPDQAVTVGGRGGQLGQ